MGVHVSRCKVRVRVCLRERERESIESTDGVSHKHMCVVNHIHFILSNIQSACTTVTLVQVTISVNSIVRVTISLFNCTHNH